MTSAQTPEYSLTVYVAAPGTPHVRDGVTTYSVPGHLYWSISDGSTVNGYGFGPREAGDTSGPGRVSILDHLEYQNPTYERRIGVSREQYEALKTFGEASVRGQDPRFNSSGVTDSYGFGNNCVDYTWKALEIAGLDRRHDYAPGERPSTREVLFGPNDQFDVRELRLRPVDNIDALKLLRDPIPGHPANQTIERERPPLPDDTLKNEAARRALSAADPRLPDHPDHERYGRIEALVRGEDEKLGRSFDERSANLVASLTVASKRDDIEPVHLAFSHEDKARGIAAGQNVFLYDGDPVREPWYQRTMLPTEQAIRTPATESFRELQVVNRGLAQQQSEEHALAMQYAPVQESAGARTL